MNPWESLPGSEVMQVAGSCCSWWLEIAFVVKPNRISRLPRYLELFWTPRTTSTRERTRRGSVKACIAKASSNYQRLQGSKQSLLYCVYWLLTTLPKVASLMRKQSISKQVEFSVDHLLKNTTPHPHPPPTCINTELGFRLTWWHIASLAKWTHSL